MNSNDLSLNNIFSEKVKINTRKNKKSDECHELKNIAYKTMLLNGNNINPNIDTLDDKIINKFLENESQANKIEIWIKLDKTQKIKKLYNYCDNILKNKYNLSDNEVTDIKKYLIKCIDRKNLLKCKEVTYCNIDKIIKIFQIYILMMKQEILFLKKMINMYPLLSLYRMINVINQDNKVHE